MNILKVMLILALLLPAAAWAQEETVTKTTNETTSKTISRVDEILRVIGLPTIAEEARRAGLPDEDVRIILDEAQKQDLPPSATEAILQNGRDAALESGPVDNFGAFVQARLRDGLRGQDLAAAIHSEHKMRGKGIGQVKDKKQGQGNNKGQDKDRNDDNEERGNRTKTNKGGKK